MIFARNLCCKRKNIWLKIAVRKLETEILFSLTIFIKKVVLGICTGISSVDFILLRVCCNQRILIYSKSDTDLFGTEKLIKIFCNFMWWYVLVAIHDILYLLAENRRWFYTIKFILDSESKDFLILTIILYESEKQLVNGYVIKRLLLRRKRCGFQLGKGVNIIYIQVQNGQFKWFLFSVLFLSFLL